MEPALPPVTLVVVIATFEILGHGLHDLAGPHIGAATLTKGNDAGYVPFGIGCFCLPSAKTAETASTAMTSIIMHFIILFIRTSSNIHREIRLYGMRTP
jgi:hypothetical protein